MEKELIIPQSIHKKMIEHGEQGIPFESCGLLAGNNMHTKSIWRLENEQLSDRRFFVSKAKVGEVIEKIRQRNEEVLAIYHTHPTTSPIPSRYDLIHHPTEHVKMVIISYKSTPPLAKCYQIYKNNYEECLFYIEPLQ
ncbi:MULTISPECIES: M67 family metallopeptidase [Clostridia]|uniref:M67 family metallopeptidase n=1 Tax=Clostridia TaxID=186801 RepID=UPI000EA3F6B3|nr:MULTISPECIES: M67 family metallopeptidase [Clostridia]NBJ68080.1 M67 family peptidase [Roseburia sp. 1XD42-34]RKI82521.1 M67 family peptidase [Clostridium sp. 1xD42-85]